MQHDQNDSRFLGNPLQRGGIRTGTLDTPQPMGGGSTLVALIETGGGLTATVSLDRCGDLVDAFYFGKAIGWLSPTDIRTGNDAHDVGLRWLDAWPGGLLTTCGPRHIGASTAEHGQHGRYQHLPAAVTAIHNPAVADEDRAFYIDLVVTDSSTFRPTLQLKRRISGVLGEPMLRFEDSVTNLGNSPSPHHQLYHINLGYPLISPGASIEVDGEPICKWGGLKDSKKLFVEALKIPEVLDEHRGVGEEGFAVKSQPVKDATVGLLSADGQTLMKVTYSGDTLPKLGVWRHFGPNSYVCGLEPYAGSLFDDDKQPDDPPAELQPSESVTYHVEIRLESDVKH
jgi:hypothetical protein